MAYTNSPLVNYTKLSPNHSGQRNQPISKITIHHMAGNLTVEACGNVFAPTSRQASSNYGIGSDGRVGLYVEEKNRSWASSSSWNDNRAVTIEVANSYCAEPWPISDKAMETLIDLCTDICKRNGMKKLEYTGDSSGSLTMHKMYAATGCPGTYLSSKFPYIASEVTKRLNGSNTTTPTTTPTTTKKSNEEIANEVIQGKWGNGDERKRRLTAAGYDYDAIQAIVAQKMAKSNTTTKPATKKSNEEIAKEVIQGKWGNGDTRKKKLTAAGYDYAAVQAIVTKLMSGSFTKKSNEAIAKEVIQGKWGSGETRKQKLTAAGYDYNTIQALVNKMLS